jgi:hypothetical protein
MVDVFQAQRQLRQKLQPPRLRAGSVSFPEQPGHAHVPTATRASAAARSNMRSGIVPQGLRGQRASNRKPRSARSAGPIHQLSSFAETFEASRVRNRSTFTTEQAATNLRQALTGEIGRARVEVSALALCTLSPPPNCTGDAAPSWARAWLSWHQLEGFRCAFRFQRCISNRCLAVGP